MLDNKSFEGTLKAIAGMSEGLAEKIHDAGLYAIEQANTHRNITPALRLVEAMGRKHDAQRVVTWLCHFSIMRVSKGSLVASKKQAPENYLEEANNLPYWELTPQKPLVNKIDYLALLRGIIKRADKAQQDGKEELHPEVLDKVQEILDIYDNQELTSQACLDGGK